MLRLTQLAVKRTSMSRSFIRATRVPATRVLGGVSASFIFQNGPSEENNRGCTGESVFIFALMQSRIRVLCTGRSVKCVTPACFSRRQTPSGSVTSLYGDFGRVGFLFKVRVNGCSVRMVVMPARHRPVRAKDDDPFAPQSPPSNGRDDTTGPPVGR